MEMKISRSGTDCDGRRRLNGANPIRARSTVKTETEVEEPEAKVRSKCVDVGCLKKAKLNGERSSSNLSLFLNIFHFPFDFSFPFFMVVDG